MTVHNHTQGASAPSSLALQPALAWHYTTGAHFIAIVADGFLDPRYTVTPAGERNILWFSTASHWEATAQKLMAHKDGSMELLGMSGTFKHARGLVRFGLKARDTRLEAWPRLGRRAGMSATIIRSLEERGMEQGAKPSQWFGSFKRIPLRDLVIEVAEAVEDGFRWVRVEGGAQ